MRAFFLLLLLANLGYFAWSNYYAGTDLAPGPNPLEREIAADKLRVLPPAGPAKPEPAPAPPPAIACLEWGGFSLAEALRAAEALAPLALGARMSQRQAEDSAGWWVFMAPQGGRQGALKKAAELKALGIEDYYILPEDGPLRFALSLGVFKTEAAASSRLEALRARGVKTAQLGPRDTQVQKTYLQVRQVDEALATRLAQIAQGFATTELRPCAGAGNS